MVVHSRLVPSFVCNVCSRRGNTKRIPYHVDLALSEIKGRYVAHAVRLGRCWLPLQTDALSSMRSSPKTTSVPVHLLRSGWDRDLDLPSPRGSLRSKRFSLFKRAESTRASTPSPPPPDDEVLFAQSTHKYLASSTAQQLCLPTPPPAIRLQGISFSPRQSLIGTPVIPPAAMDVDPIISESPNSPVFSMDMWPRPLSTSNFSVSPQVSVTNLPDPPRPSSPLSTRSSLGSTIIDALGAIPTHFRDAPFSVDGPGITAVAPVQGPNGSISHHSSTRRGPKKNDKVYMTVVHETATGP